MTDTSSCQVCGVVIVLDDGGAWVDAAVDGQYGEGRVCGLTGSDHVPGVVQPEPVDQ